MRKILIFSLLSLMLGRTMAQEQADYILKYQDLAVSEMHRTGIPASIKLAQAILESNSGQSELARKANNHFGIKCGGEWTGKSYQREDDDYKNGKLVKSCFREFNSVIESYIAHSEFLMDPNKATRYGSLFDLEATDYKGWAKGLSICGYATDPQYANRLIYLIEKYELFRFDHQVGDELVASAEAPSTGLYIRYNNKVKYTLAQPGDKPAALAKRHDVSVHQLMQYNEDIHRKDQLLVSGSKVYLRPKKSKFLGKQQFHFMKEEEDMIMLAQRYGIKLSALLKRNGLEENDIPRAGQKIYLSGRPKTEIQKVNPYEVPSTKTTSEEPLASVKKETPTAIKKTTVSTGTAVKTTPADKGTQTTKELAQHVVTPGDTLYSISRAYGLSVTDLKKINNLSADTIYVGQKLKCQ